MERLRPCLAGEAASSSSRPKVKPMKRRRKLPCPFPAVPGLLPVKYAFQYFLGWMQFMRQSSVGVWLFHIFHAIMDLRCWGRFSDTCSVSASPEEHRFASIWKRLFGVRRCWFDSGCTVIRRFTLLFFLPNVTHVLRVGALRYHVSTCASYPAVASRCLPRLRSTKIWILWVWLHDHVSVFSAQLGPSVVRMLGISTFLHVQVDLGSRVRCRLSDLTRKCGHFAHTPFVFGFCASVHGGLYLEEFHHFPREGVPGSCGRRPCDHAATSGGASDQLVDKLMAV